MEDYQTSNPKFSISTVATIFILAFLLAAYSAQGFFDAPYRARVAKAKSEMRNIAIALETYHLETNAYPPGIEFAGNISEVKELFPEYLSKPPLELDIIAYVYGKKVRKVCSVLGLVLIAARSLLLLINILRAKSKCKVEMLCLGAFFCFALLTSTNDMALFLFYVPVFASSVYCIAFLGSYLHAVKYRKVPFSRLQFMFAIYLPGILFLMALTSLAGSAYIAHKVAEYPEQYYRYATDGQTSYLLYSCGPDTDYDLSNANIFDGSSATGTILEKIESLAYDPTNGTLSNGDVYRVGP